MKPPALLEQSGGVAHGRRRAVGIVNLTLTSTLVTKSGAEISFASGSPAPDIAARMRDLGMPPGHATHIRQTGQEWGDEWREYELDFLGVPVPFLAAERPPWP